MRRLGIVWLLVTMLAINGCFFGTFQTAETLAPGEVDAGWYGNYPLYFNKSDRDSSKAGPDSLGAFVTPNVGGYLAYGTTGNLDIGLRASLGEGLGPFMKMKLLGRGAMVSDFFLDAAFLAGFGYHPVAQGISCRLEALLSRRLSSFSSIYFGWLGVRTPDYRRLAYHFAKTSDIEEFTFLNALYLGVDLTRKESPMLPLGAIPIGITMEFAVPLVKYPALFFGLQFRR